MPVAAVAVAVKADAENVDKTLLFMKEADSLSWPLFMCRLCIGVAGQGAKCRRSGHKKHLVVDRTDGKSVLTVKTVTVGMSKAHGSTLFTLMPFNSIFAT